MEYRAGRVRAVPEPLVGPPIEATCAMQSRAARAATGPGSFRLAELDRYGLGVIVRILRVPGTPVQEPLRRLYCLSCGRAVAHEPLIAEWWICTRGCNGATGVARSEGEITGESA